MWFALVIYLLAPIAFMRHLHADQGDTFSRRDLLLNLLFWLPLWLTWEVVRWWQRR